MLFSISLQQGIAVFILDSVSETVNQAQLPFTEEVRKDKGFYPISTDG
jgi:hypothetical protein